MLFTATCAATTIINQTPEWIQQDAAALNRAQLRCQDIYPESPCLRVFKKLEPSVYSAICGVADAVIPR